VIEKGQPITLTWETANSNEVSINAVGMTTETLGLLEPSGSLQLTPSNSTTYTLYAKGPGGEQSASTRITVTQPGPPPTPSSELSEDELFSRTMKMFTLTSIAGKFVPTNRV
jgi:peptidoglycan-associated lipoprotein